MKSSLLFAVTAAVLSCAPAFAALPDSTFEATASGWLSDKGDAALNDPTQRNEITFATTVTAKGGQQVVGGEALGHILPNNVRYAEANGFAIAEPGRIAAELHGYAQVSGPTPAGPIAQANVGAHSIEYIPITHPTLPAGTLVDFIASVSVSGTVGSEVPNSGPYKYSGFPYSTGTFFFIFNANTITGDTNTYNNDIVSTGTYSFPNGLFTSVPALNHTWTFPMKGRVGDILVLNTSLGLGVEDRAYSGYGQFQRSDLDYSHTINLNVDPVTVGLTFEANGHNYVTVPEPASALIGIACTVLLMGRRRRQA